jgi:dual specificity MAP kinase phosphatase
MSFYNEIIPNLYLGSIEASQDNDFIFGNNISVIVNCTKDIKDTYSLNLLKPIEDAPKEVQNWLYENSYYIKYYRIPVDDNGKESEINNFYKYTVEILNSICDEYKKGKKILVHCLAGNQRSAAFICAFLMMYNNINLDKSILYLLRKKANVFFFGKTINFKNALEKIEKDLFLL